MATRRARVGAILDGIRDGSVDATLGDRIVTAFCSMDAYRQQWAARAGLAEVPAVADMTNDQKADLYLGVMRQFCREVVAASEANAAAETARQAALTRAQAEVDLGGG